MLPPFLENELLNGKRLLYFTDTPLHFDFIISLIYIDVNFLFVENVCILFISNIHAGLLQNRKAILLG